VIYHPTALPCTGWPTVIKHDPTGANPTLTVNPDHFQPFITFLRGWHEWYATEGRQNTRDKSVIMFTEFPLVLQCRLKELLDPQFKIRPKSVSQAEITQTVGRLLNLDSSSQWL
jgi:hypothetical protein